MKSLEQTAYEAYGNKTDWKNFQGDPMPKWKDLPTAIQEAWHAAVMAVVNVLED